MINVFILVAIGYQWIIGVPFLHVDKMILVRYIMLTEVDELISVELVSVTTFYSLM